MGYYRPERKELGMCVECPERDIRQAVEGQTRCEKHAEAARVRRRKHERIMRGYSSTSQKDFLNGY